MKMTEKQRIARARTGGQATKAKYGFVRCDCGFLHRTSDFYARNGQNGGLKTVEIHGAEHMREIGKLGGRGNKKERVNVSQTDHR
jgi:hypothetical protein